jgi:hypothetical protein
MYIFFFLSFFQNERDNSCITHQSFKSKYLKLDKYKRGVFYIINTHKALTYVPHATLILPN